MEQQMRSTLYVFIVRRNVAHVMDWYGNAVTKDMPTAFARRYVARFGSAS